MAVFDKVTLEVQERMEEISLILMRHENKDFCLAKVHPNSWRLLSYSNNHKEYRFILVPSPAFERLIIQREYPKIVDRFPEYFGTGNDWNIIRAIKEYDKNHLLREYSDREFFDYTAKYNDPKLIRNIPHELSKEKTEEVKEETVNAEVVENQTEETTEVKEEM